MAAKQTITVELTGGWKKLKVMLSAAQFEKALKTNLKRATTLNAQFVRREVRKRIQGGGYTPNAALTVAIKGSTKALVDHADLMNAVTTVVVDEKTAFIGVQKQAKTKDGDDLVNIAAVVHEGVTIPVTEPMRALFQLVYEATRRQDPTRLTGRALEIYDQVSKHGGQFYPLKADTVAIVIPGRPFIRDVIEDAAVLTQVRTNWEAAVQAAYTEVKG
jgi:hypothetical protein